MKNSSIYGNIYDDIAKRTQGSVYMGVVGPVRTGKSTFIKRFMDLLVLPNIENMYTKERAKDELPQSAAGRTIMTTEPKFVPNEAVEITVGENTRLKVRMIDCVGYIVDSALGHIEGEAPRMVKTPWSDEEMPFAQAAEIGTKKVITEHSTIGIVVTTDGSVCDITRPEYVTAEERVVREMQAINKPFIIVLNSKHPNSDETQQLKMELERKYSSTVLAVDCAELNKSDINSIIENVLYQFPLSEISFFMPRWIDALPAGHWLKNSLFTTVSEGIGNLSVIRDVFPYVEKMKDCEYLDNAVIQNIALGEGKLSVMLNVENGLFYKVLSETSGFDICDDYSLIDLINQLSAVKKEYDKVSYALNEVQRTGYGIVSPTIDELTLEEPEIVKQGGKYGVRLKASAPSIHMIRADIETEVNPIVGTEKQSEELVHYLLDEYEEDPTKIWSSNIFGKSLHELVNEGLHNKLYKMPPDAQLKLQETLQKIINEGSGGLICIIL